jgi:DNA-directed RNA polymerase specialized sigma24 family protein
MEVAEAWSGMPTGVGTSGLRLGLPAPFGQQGYARLKESATADPELDSAVHPASFEAFYVASYEKLVRLAYVLTSSREVAEDLVQDSFVRLHAHYENVESPDRYIRRCVVNASRSYFRRAGRERDKRPLLYVIPGTGDGPGASGELNDVLLSLPYRQRAAIVLRYYSDLSENEIGEVLGCRPGTVGSLIHRGLERMRKALQE